MALTLGGGPSQFSKGKFLLKGCVGCSGSPVMWDRECEVWGQKCDHLCSNLTLGELFLGSRDSPTQLARLRRGAVRPRGWSWPGSLSRAPNEWYSLSCPVHSTGQGGKFCRLGGGRRRKRLG